MVIILISSYLPDMVWVGAEVLLVGGMSHGLLQQEPVLKLVLDPLLCIHTLAYLLFCLD